MNIKFVLPLNMTQWNQISKESHFTLPEDKQKILHHQKIMVLILSQNEMDSAKKWKVDEYRIELSNGHISLKCMVHSWIPPNFFPSDMKWWEKNFSPIGQLSMDADLPFTNCMNVFKKIRNISKSPPLRKEYFFQFFFQIVFVWA